MQNTHTAAAIERDALESSLRALWLDRYEPGLMLQLLERAYREQATGLSVPSAGEVPDSNTALQEWRARLSCFVCDYGKETLAMLRACQGFLDWGRARAARAQAVLEVEGLKRWHELPACPAHSYLQLREQAFLKTATVQVSLGQAAKQGFRLSRKEGRAVLSVPQKLGALLREMPWVQAGAHMPLRQSLELTLYTAPLLASVPGRELPHEVAPLALSLQYRLQGEDGTEPPLQVFKGQRWLDVQAPFGEGGQAAPAMLLRLPYRPLDSERETREPEEQSSGTGRVQPANCMAQTPGERMQKALAQVGLPVSLLFPEANAVAPMDAPRPTSRKMSP